ncbi:MAG: tetratricopeptide repeat protein, partial [Candidatus Omnitrophica bacterium]|nr:tetratricopeptide repeat protein [Candidatus Omnitrophota bacterium]
MIKIKREKIVTIFLIFFGLIFLYCSTILYAAQSGQNIKDYLSKADKYYKDGKYQEAISFWNEVLTVEPDNIKARQGIEDAEGKIAKIRDFFGTGVFKEFSKTGEFSLDDCLRVSVENSIPLEAARAQMRLAQIKVWEARRGFFPALSVSWTQTSGIQAGGKVEGVEYGLEGKQPAFRSGSIMYTL